MRIGHINLAASINGIGEHFVRLVESLGRQGARQHVIVRIPDLARRVAVCEGVTVGPIVRSAVTACCLMPETDVVHVHDPKAAQAGLMLKLTRSMPYVLSWSEFRAPGRNPLLRSILHRASGIVCPDAEVVEALISDDISGVIDLIADINHVSAVDEQQENKIAAQYMRVYRRAGDSRRVPALLL